MENDDDFSLKLASGSAGEGVQRSVGNAGQSQGKYLKQCYYLGDMYIGMIVKDENAEIPEKRAEAAKRRGPCTLIVRERKTTAQVTDERIIARWQEKVF